MADDFEREMAALRKIYQVLETLPPDRRKIVIREMMAFFPETCCPCDTDDETSKAAAQLFAAVKP